MKRSGSNVSGSGQNAGWRCVTQGLSATLLPAGMRYPPILLTTAEGDSRVDPMHARKMAALLQAQSEDPNAVVLLRVDRDAGHGIGKPLQKQVDELADQWAFLAWRTGLPIGETGMLGRQ